MEFQRFPLIKSKKTLSPFSVNKSFINFQPSMKQFDVLARTLRGTGFDEACTLPNVLLFFLLRNLRKLFTYILRGHRQEKQMCVRVCSIKQKRQATYSEKCDVKLFL
jgi:hypothetical protein